MKRIFCIISFWLILVLIPLYSLAVDTQYISNKKVLKDLFEGNGIEIKDIRIVKGRKTQFGKFSGASSVTGFSNIDEGFILSTGFAIDMFVPAENFLSQDYDGVMLEDVEDDLNYKIDEAWIEFDVKSNTEDISFQYIFASEEYDQDPVYNDKMSIEIKKKNEKDSQYKNIALIPNSDKEVSINNTRNTKYHYDNYNGTDIGYLGYTPLLTCQTKVTPNVEYTIKISIADLGDDIYDSAVFIKAKSLSSETPVPSEENPNPSTRKPGSGGTPSEKPVEETPKIEIKKQISGIKIISPNNNVVADITVEGNKLKNAENLGYLLDNALIVFENKEIVYGSTLKIEYTITVENKSKKSNCLNYTITNPKNDNFVYVADDEILTDDKKINSSESWILNNNGDVNFISSKGNKKNPGIKPGEKVEKTIVLQTIISEKLIEEGFVDKLKVEAKFERTTLNKETQSDIVQIIPNTGDNYNEIINNTLIFISILISTYIVYIKIHK